MLQKHLLNIIKLKIYIHLMVLYPLHYLLPRLSLEGRKEYIEKYKIKPQGLIKIEQNGCEND